MLEMGLELPCLAVRKGLFDPARLFAGGEAGAWYDPSDLASLFQDAGGTVPAAVDAPVGLLRDKSGRGNHASQTAPASRPMLRGDGGGRLYLEFDGADDWMASGAFTCPQPWDRASAFRQVTWADGDRIFGSANVNGVGSLYQRSTANQIRIYSGALGPITSGLALGTDHVATERHHGGSSRLAIDNGAYVAGDAGTLAPPNIELGSYNGGAQPGHFRLYGVCMIGRALNDGETAALRRFMAAKAGAAL